MQLPSLKIRLNTNEATMPIKATPESAGYDISSAEQITIEPNTHALIHTHISIEIPPEHFGMLKSRSGLASKSIPRATCTNMQQNN